MSVCVEKSQSAPGHLVVLFCANRWHASLERQSSLDASFLNKCFSNTNVYYRTITHYHCQFAFGELVHHFSLTRQKYHWEPSETLLVGVVGPLNLYRTSMSGKQQQCDKSVCKKKSHDNVSGSLPGITLFRALVCNPALLVLVSETTRRKRSLCLVGTQQSTNWDMPVL